MTADVIVVGAGVVGAATAFHLSRLGAGDVLVVDRGAVGSGMSSRSSALVRMHYTFGPEVDLAVRSDQMFNAWPDLVGRPPCIRRTGFVRIVPPGEEDNLAANVEMQKARGARTELVGAVELAALAPGLRTDDIGCAAWEPHGGYGDGAVVAGDLLAAARDSGVRYQAHTAVRSLLCEENRVTGILTAAGAEHAGVVVVAVGVWSASLLSTAGVALPIDTEFHQVAVLSHAAGLGAPLCCIDSTTQTYFRPEAAGAMTLVGSFTGPRGVDPDNLPGSAEAELAEIVGAASMRVPALADAGIRNGVTGAYDMTPDARPLLGEVPGISGLILAAGFSGMGFKISPAVGEAIAELIVLGNPTRVDLAPFRPGRFADGQPIEPEFGYADD